MSNFTENRIATLGALGGNIFDYFIDKGIKKVNIYAESSYIDALAAICSQAFWLGIEIDGIYSDNETDIPIEYFERCGISKIHALDIKKSDDVKSQFITISDKIPKINAEYYRFTELFKYSFRKNIIYKKILHYKEKYYPNMKIIILTTPFTGLINNPSDWEKKLTQNMATTAEMNNKLLKDLMIDGYINLASSHAAKRINDCYFIADFHYKNLVNNIGGYRITTDIPESANRTIYTFGSSNCYCYGADDYHTIQSVLQRKLNEYFNDKNPYKILNCANGGYANYKKQIASFFYHKPNNNDIVIFIDITYSYLVSQMLYENYKDKILFIRPHEDDRIFDRPHNYGEIFTNSTSHLNNAGYTVIGEYLARKMIENNVFDNKESNNEKISETNIKYKDEKREISPELVQYLQNIKTIAPKIGSIVMNCNPFTLGHRYLIEESAKKVTSLIIFVVEEDKSFFPFEDRIELVRKGTQDLPNVTVVPSGGFIISQQTFGAYFEKELNKEQQIDPTNDVEIFASSIAPSLGITIRFAGEEPLDYITQQYNDTMARVLPRYNIDFEVIPRKESDGEVISASRVRTLLKEKDFEGISKIVPEKTLEYLKEKYS